MQENAKADLPTPDELASFLHANRQGRSVGCVFVDFAQRNPEYAAILASILLTRDVAEVTAVEVITKLGIPRQRSVINVHRNGRCLQCNQHFLPLESHVEADS